VVVPAG